ncbi:uncharacterized protein BX664DRAFT_341828 [Halteromyces radiatus]|uniref:uncharacterized protein n=1 Tax=Halteromyces radiatus TaxID=101107 RepID=UPI0022207CC3|nr:uncharacterized protein BX664DRAFT_341828 [Halteromyces radiatus]KAI8079925.1 hypothetical protein BX664DRAFT_341828 [Halteromyces radiatus]
MVTSMSSQKRHVILIGTFLIFLLTISYYQYATSSTNDQPSLYIQQQDDLPIASPIISLSTSSSDDNSIIQPCDKGDIPWLASDRQYWDGWKTKSFFLLPDGNFTLDNVIIEQENGLCIVVLLGPIPAASKIKVESHYAPPDSITMTAIGKHYRIPITLHQYPKQSNAYYANVYFRHSDSYILKSTTEFRSYFWETPIQHNYQPFSFDSSNMVIVTPSAYPSLQQPACEPNQPVEGSWRNDTNQFQFIPDHCEMKYTRQDGLRCLRRKTIHVWADANLRRNLKTLASPYWCDINNDPEATCICNDDLEDPDHLLYPWAADHNIPLALGDNKVHYNSINSITTQDWRQEMAMRVKDQLPPADLVIVGVGNDDIPLSRMKPSQFANALSDLLHHMTTTVYPDQIIILRTPQFFGTGQHYYTSWNAGRSRAFANVVRDLVHEYPRVKLWDTHQLGLEDNTCRYQGTTYSRRNVVDVENQLLLNLFCGV